MQSQWATLHARKFPNASDWPFVGVPNYNAATARDIMSWTNSGLEDSLSVCDTLSPSLVAITGGDFADIVADAIEKYIRVACSAPSGLFRQDCRQV